jgi:hypothetical protein
LEQDARCDNYDVGAAVDAAVDVDIDDVVGDDGDAAVGGAAAAGDDDAAFQSLHDNDLGHFGEYEPSHPA